MISYLVILIYRFSNSTTITTIIPLIYNRNSYLILLIYNRNYNPKFNHNTTIIPLIYNHNYKPKFNHNTTIISLINPNSIIISTIFTYL